MEDGITFRPAGPDADERRAALRELLAERQPSFAPGAEVAVKAHWGERGNHSFLSPGLLAEVVRWVTGHGGRPYVCDTTVLYAGSRRTAADSLATARRHGYDEATLGCPVVIADGHDGRDVVDLPGLRHFPTVQVAAVVERADAFVVFSHFKGHLVAGFGGAIKNLSMGFASRAQKQRMHANANPVLIPARCTRCGLCAEVCPTGAAVAPAGPQAWPTYDRQTCIGCAQCIALCPEVALRIHWRISPLDFQERLVESAAAVWRRIGTRTLLVNALLQITAECDCMRGKNPVIAADVGFLAGTDPVELDWQSLQRVGRAPFDEAHAGIPWERQFEYARQLGLGEAGEAR